MAAQRIWQILISNDPNLFNLQIILLFYKETNQKLVRTVLDKLTEPIKLIDKYSKTPWHKAQGPATVGKIYKEDDLLPPLGWKEQGDNVIDENQKEEAREGHLPVAMAFTLPPQSEPKGKKLKKLITHPYTPQIYCLTLGVTYTNWKQGSNGAK